MAKKWIVTDDNRFIMGNTDFHYQLLPDKGEVSNMRSLMSFGYQKPREKAKCVGGGWWHIDKENKKVYLYSTSQDFGYCSQEDLISAIDNSFVREVEQGYKFYFSYQEKLEDALQYSSLLPIVYEDSFTERDTLNDYI
jgi:hypothetical protein